MTSILTNTAATAALQTLRSVSSNLGKTQSQVSSGLRVGSASDNAAYWSIATTMKSDKSALGAVQDALNLGAAKLDVTYEAMSSTIDLISQFKSKLVLAKEPGTDRSAIDSDLTQLQQQMRSTAYSASFNGVNYLALTDNNWQGTVIDQTEPAYISRDGSNFSVGTLKVFDATHAPWTYDQFYSLVDDTGGAQTGDGGILTSDAYAQMQGANTDWVMLKTLGNPDPALGIEMHVSDQTSEGDIDEMINVTEAMQQQVTSWAAKVGDVQSRISSQLDFTSDQIDSIGKGVGKLVDANMEESSTRLSALQTQQQLAIQSLSIANSSASNLMTLFR